MRSVVTLLVCSGLLIGVWMVILVALASARRASSLMSGGWMTDQARAGLRNQYDGTCWRWPYTGWDDGDRIEQPRLRRVK